MNPLVISELKLPFATTTTKIVFLLVSTLHHGACMPYFTVQRVQPVSDPGNVCEVLSHPGMVPSGHCAPATFV